MEEWDGRGFGNDKPGDSIASVKKRYPIDRVLHVLSGKNYVPRGGHQGWLSVPCPFHEDRKPSASLNVALGKFTCHSCGLSGDIFDIVQGVLGLLTVKEAKEWITSNV